MSDQKNIRIIWHLFVSFPDKFVICGVTIESPIESPMESPKILTSPDSSVQDWPYWGYLYPPKTNYMQVPMTWYNIDHHKSQITNHKFTTVSHKCKQVLGMLQFYNSNHLQKYL